VGKTVYGKTFDPDRREGIAKEKTPFAGNGSDKGKETPSLKLLVPGNQGRNYTPAEDISGAGRGRWNLRRGKEHKKTSHVMWVVRTFRDLRTM